MNKYLLLLLLFFNCTFCSAEFVTDEIANELPRAVKQPVINNNYNYEPTETVEIELKIINPINSETEVYEGQYINFKIAKDIIYNNEIILSRGTIVPAKVAVIISPGMNGIPASIIFNNFDIEGLPKNKITPSYEITGQNRSPLVFPLKWALTILPPTGSLTNFIMGGHAKVKPKKHLIINYYPKWN